MESIGGHDAYFPSWINFKRFFLLHSALRWATWSDSKPAKRSRPATRLSVALSSPSARRAPKAMKRRKNELLNCALRPRRSSETPTICCTPDQVYYTMVGRLKWNLLFAPTNKLNNGYSSLFHWPSLNLKIFMVVRREGGLRDSWLDVSHYWKHIASLKFFSYIENNSLFAMIDHSGETMRLLWIAFSL